MYLIQAYDKLKIWVWWSI